MTFLSRDGTYILEARTQANLKAKCIGCGSEFKQNADAGVYGLTFCGVCIKTAKPGKMPSINYPMNERF